MDSFIYVLWLLRNIVWYAVACGIIAVIALMLVRLLVTYADMNPFSRTFINIRALSDPLINPVRRSLARMGVDPKYSPLIVILVAIVLGYFTVQLTTEVLGTLAGITGSIQRGSFISVVGYLLYGLLAVYTLLIFMRIVFSWGASSVNRVMRFLIRVTEPVLGPFRRIIPPLGMFDISPIVVLLLLRLLQEFVAGTLIR
ncbi:MAG TPA: YggT family protein [Pyrinomonadaceae bacterium]|nr:YggT family protein [Pyrinomonadaceae bacterium]